jgi:hypothetical protein
MLYTANAYILVPPKNTTALEGTRVRLVCQAEAHPGNISYQWYRDGVDVHHVTGLMSRAGVYADGSFIISSVLRDDTGWYRCQPTNGIGQPPSAEAYLNVTCKYARANGFTSLVDAGSACVRACALSREADA